MPPKQEKALTVFQLNTLLRAHLESEPLWMDVWVTGEISNWRAVPALGQIYFSLSDKQASLSCVLFQTTVSRLAFLPKDKDQVSIRGKIRFFQKRGTVHLQVNYMMPAGVGNQALQLDLLKAQLREEGLFETDRKKDLPRLPARIAIVTAADSAGFADFVKVFSATFPWVQLLLFPSLVQGASAPVALMRALDAADASDANVVVLLRGGGSQEDLSCFNNEALVRRMASMQKPTITAIGHETDTTLADLVSDMRTATPTAAAHLLAGLLRESVAQILGELIGQRRILLSRIENTVSRIKRDQVEIQKHLKHRLETTRQKTLLLLQAIRMADPLMLLQKGYSIVRHDGHVVRHAADLTNGDVLSIHMQDGSVCAIVRKE